MKRSFLVLGLSVFAVFGSDVAGFPGSGGLCTLLLAFLAGLGWGAEKVKAVQRVLDPSISRFHVSAAALISSCVLS